MRITLRLIVSLIIAVSATASFFAFHQVKGERMRLMEDLDRQSKNLSESLQETVEPLLEGPRDRLDRVVQKFSRLRRIEGVAVYGPGGESLALSKSLVPVVSEIPRPVREAADTKIPGGGFEIMGGRNLYVHAHPMGKPGEKFLGTLVVFHDASYIQARLHRLWRNTFLRLLVQMVLISVITLLMLRWSVAGPIAQMADWMKKFRAGELPGPLTLPQEDLFAPITREVTRFARHLTRARSAAEEEARLRTIAEAQWTEERLKEFVRNKLKDRPLVLVSNREPYMHVMKGRKVEWIVPAGGLVKALDPVLRATGGTWVAHGSGDADAETSDKKGRLKVPPEEGLYTLRRIWLTKEEEAGYYYGFANEGLWPLCHVAHTRPMFRSENWAQYQAVNQKFASAILEEIHGLEEPCVLVQDYHFALLPRLLKEARPDARVSLFWHIPWPNPETFGICPWKREILYGMLGADILGFHIQFHCNNFLETVDRTLESHIDWERFAVNKAGHTTLVKPYPISVDMHENAAMEKPDRSALLKDLGVQAEFLAVGVDRVDYTKGILERFRAVERFLEKNPRYQGRFTLIQLGAPSRTHIPRYHDFLAEVEQEADRINWKFKGRNWRPIVLFKRHHNPQEILPFYLTADLCLVTSLHDGMNLVAKEFVAARRDESGVLILSVFAGASRELSDALLVNPYDVDETAEAIRVGLEMPAAEKADRMRRMREVIHENNIYRWAGNLITDLTGLPSARTPVVPG